MSRAYCYQCRRAKITCLCGRIEKQPNTVSVVVLQHPEETSNPKGSAIIAELGLKQYQRWVGENFLQHPGLNKLLGEEEGSIAVLYPAEDSQKMDNNWLRETGKCIKTLIVIDGTWRKARKIWEMNAQLHALPTVRLAEGKLSEYRIRKAPQEGYLSTVECIVEGLRSFEEDFQAYQPLLDLFSEMIDFQIDKMGQKTYTKNYLDKK